MNKAFRITLLLAALFALVFGASAYGPNWPWDF